MVAVVVDSQSSGDRIEVIGEGDVGCLSGRSANREAGVSASVGPHVCAGAIQDLHACLIDTDRHVRGGGGGREEQRM